jgi:hypothetical protein
VSKNFFKEIKKQLKKPNRQIFILVNMFVLGTLIKVAHTPTSITQEIDKVGLQVQILSLLATAWFTWQLVENDNKRQADAERTESFRKLKTALYASAKVGKESLKIMAHRIYDHNPEKTDLLFEAYYEILLENVGTIPSFPEFREIMNEKSVSFDKQFKI